MSINREDPKHGACFHCTAGVEKHNLAQGYEIRQDMPKVNRIKSSGSMIVVECYNEHVNYIYIIHQHNKKVFSVTVKCLITSTLLFMQITIFPNTIDSIFAL